MTKTLYFNIEDDLTKVVARLKREAAERLVLVFPKQSYLFSDGVNLKMLKKQTDLLGKQVAILTMDERGQVYAKDAGIELRQVSLGGQPGGMRDIKVSKPATSQVGIEKPAAKSGTKKDVAKPAPSAKKRTAKTVVPEVVVKDMVFPDLAPHRAFVSHSARKTTRLSRLLLASVAVVLIAVVLLVVVVLPRATIAVYAKSEPIVRDIEVSMSASITSPDSERLVMPAQSFDKTVERQDTFTANGKKEVGSKAAGKVRVFNFAALPLNLKADTTTLTYTKTSKTYYFTKDQNGIKPIPASQATSPGVGTVVDVIAADGGESFNIPAGTRLEIANQVFGSKPQFLYAVTEGEVLGGSSRFLSYVSSEDINGAKKALTEAIVADEKKALAEGGLTLPDQAFTVEVLSFAADKPEGTETTAFGATAKARILGLTFNGVALNRLLRDRVVSQLLPQNKKLQDVHKDVITYRVKRINLDAGTASVTAHFESKALYIVPVQDLARSVAGKDKEAASEILLSKPEINRVDIYLSPVWQNALPRLVGKIKVEERQ